MIDNFALDNFAGEMDVKGKIINTECKLLSIDADFGGGTRRSIYFEFCSLDQILILRDGDIEYETISPLNENTIHFSIYEVNHEYIKENDIFDLKGDTLKGNHLSYLSGQNVCATLFIGHEIFYELYDDIKKNIVPKELNFEFFKYGFSDDCLCRDQNNIHSIKWDISNIKSIKIWGISFVY